METGDSIGHDVSQERSADIVLELETPFCDWALLKGVKRGLENAGFVYPTAIQSKALPLAKSGMDLLIQSKSGTGKTLIFATAALEMHGKSEGLYALIVAPTREIAVQIRIVLEKLGRFCQNLKVAAFIGGTNAADDRKHAQGVNVVVGTPGRLVHLLQNKVLNPSAIKLLVLDEADKLFEESFYRDLQKIISSVPCGQRQLIAASATFSPSIKKRIIEKMHNPILVSAENKVITPIGIKQFVYEVDAGQTSLIEMENKLKALYNIFGQLQFQQCLIFAKSKSRADSYYNYLLKEGWSCTLITSALDQSTRLSHFQDLRNFETRLIVCTDLMARGVDSEHVNLVINVDLPQDTVTYLHRIGRASRFGSCGIAISLLSSESDKNTFNRIMSTIGGGTNIFYFPKDNTRENQVNFWDFHSINEDWETFKLAPKAPLQDACSAMENCSLIPRSKQQRKNSSNSLQLFPASNTIDDASSINLDTIQNSHTDMQQNRSDLPSSKSQADVFQDYFEFLVENPKDSSTATCSTTLSNFKTELRGKQKNNAVDEDVFKDYLQYANDGEGQDTKANAGKTQAPLQWGMEPASRPSEENREAAPSLNDAQRLYDDCMSTSRGAFNPISGQHYDSKDYLIALSKWMQQYSTQTKNIQRYMEHFHNTRV